MDTTGQKPISDELWHTDGEDEFERCEECGAFIPEHDILMCPQHEVMHCEHCMCSECERHYSTPEPEEKDDNE